MEPETLATLSQLGEWLQIEAEERMKQALSRKGSANVMRNLTAADLRASKKDAERMLGRKLDLVSTTVKDNEAYVSMQDRITIKLHDEAMQLSAWSDTVLSLREDKL